MIDHYCLEERTRISFEGKCNWCGITENEAAYQNGADDMKRRMDRRVRDLESQLQIAHSHLLNKKE